MECNIIKIKWEGPFTIEKAKELINKSDYGIYQFYGSHNVYGSGTLLYIGQAFDREFNVRMIEHDKNWGHREPSELSIYIGRLGGCETENISNNDEWRHRVDIAEKLLIYFSKPSYNARNLFDYSGPEIPTVVLNYGRRNLLPMEVSSIWNSSEAHMDTWKDYQLT